MSEESDEWNQRISGMQEGLTFEPLIDFLERLKETTTRSAHEMDHEDVDTQNDSQDVE